ncbi:exodeoxyribonuclease III [Nostocoides jenkinsii]|uniref:Exodeoxyribonuclease III Xth n=1 Tax=Nostocoides jenkinsii Ben 74 TaxID=1193518 RepID=A0A077M9G2_9MICO|nr:exodeoxyribonuclease III [Tetrasphaera jenkinsii]CCI52485.1 Exodeoxyribonuclease III Xth [Tetrasphaera jenkinsii Ben 74]
MLRIATVNVNGIRAAQRRGFGAWLQATNPDVVALQEVRCPEGDLPDDAFGGYHAAYDSGVRAGRNGVAVLTRHAPVAVRTLHSDGYDRPVARELRAAADQGRYLEIDLAEIPLTVASVYVPKGGLPAHLQKPGRMREAPDGGAAYDRKMRFAAGLSRHLDRSRRAAAAQGREFIVMGDFNVAHRELDVAAWRRSRQSVGFLPQEREWLAELLSPRRFVDVVRRLHPDQPGPYSWWSWMGNSYAVDSGWRIDYHFASPGLARTAVRAWVDRETDGVRISDHSPVSVDYDF